MSSNHIAEVYPFSSTKQIENLGLQGIIAERIIGSACLLINSGAKKVYIAISHSTEDFHKIISKLEVISDIALVIVDTKDTSIYPALSQHLDIMASNKKERLAIISEQSFQQALVTANTLNNYRIILSFQQSQLQKNIEQNPNNTFNTLLALAFQIAASSDPTQNFNYKKLDIIKSVDQISEDIVQQAIISGVLTLENQGQNIVVIKAVTTSSRQNNDGDTTMENISTIITVDYIIKAIRNRLDSILKDAKNNDATKQRISSQIIIIMSQFLDQGLINQFQNPNVYPSQQDSSICIIELKFNVASAVNQICLTAEIIV